MRIKWKLAVASMKMFFRQREAIIWTLLLPLFMVVLFSVVDFNGAEQVRVGIVHSQGQAEEELSSAMRSVSSIELFSGSSVAELEALSRAERDIVLDVSGSAGQGGTANLVAHVRESSSGSGELALLVVRGVLATMASSGAEGLSGTLTVLRLPGTDLSYIDFLLPGVISMSIMQMGIFGVAFSLVSFKKRGILRRLSVTPVRPSDFVIAQIAMRLLVVVLQIGMLSAVGAMFLDVHLSGSIIEMVLVGLIGALVFLGFGFAIAGVSKSEDQVAPLANIVSMPMILLSGVFFSRSNLPDIVRIVTDFLPLTYLTDTMREIAVNGATIGDVFPGVAGLCAWCLLATVAAIKLFRWE